MTYSDALGPAAHVVGGTSIQALVDSSLGRRLSGVGGRDGGGCAGGGSAGGGLGRDEGGEDADEEGNREAHVGGSVGSGYYKIRNELFS